MVVSFNGRVALGIRTAIDVADGEASNQALVRIALVSGALDRPTLSDAEHEYSNGDEGVR